MGFTHFNEAGQPKMVSIGEKMSLLGLPLRLGA